MRGTHEGVIELLDLESGDLLSRRPMRHLLRVQSAAFSPDGKQLTTIGSEGAVKIWNPATGQLVRTLDAE